MKYTISTILLLAALWHPSSASAQSQPTVEQRLATELYRVVLARLASEPLTVDGLDAAVILAEEALALDPENAELWRLTLELAMMAEREELRERAITRLAQLDKSDDVARLMRLGEAVDRFQTAEERIAACERLLADENIQKIGDAVASRLMLDLALLHQRQGDNQKFAERLSRAVALDPSNRSAAAIAAGFYRMNIDDAFGEAELLVNVMLADPTDLVSQLALARLLLENGAYAGADRIYRLAAGNYQAMGQMPTNELLADLAITQWANGDQQAALETLRLRQAELDRYVRRLTREKNSEISMEELSKIKAPIDPILATVAAGIHAKRQDPEAQAAAQVAADAYQAQIDLLKSMTEQKVPPAQYAQMYLEMAWVSVWLNVSLEKVPHYLEEADKLQPLTESAKARFAGWLALRSGDAARAAELLEPLSANDQAARLGLALAQLELGLKKDAARNLLAVNQAQPGSLIGIWSAGKLADLLGRRVSLSQTASKLEELIHSIPAPFFRFPDDATLALTLKLNPAKLTFTPYEPVIINIEVTNNSLFPMAIDPEGPIRSRVVLVPTLRTSHSPNINTMRPIVVDIGRRLRLMPNESVVVPVDLRLYPVGELLNGLGINGTIVKLVGLINFVATQEGNLATGILGSEVPCPLIRIEGEDLNREWVQRAITAMQNPNAPGALEQMGLLSLWIGPKPLPHFSDEDRALVEQARRAFDDAFDKIEPHAQAWLMSVMPRGQGDRVEGLQWVMSMARKSEHRLVQMAYLLFHNQGPMDPMLDAARRGQDPALRRLAEIVQADALRALRQPQR